MRAAKNEEAYFAKLINDTKDTASLWRAVTTITHKSRNKAKTAEIKCSPNVFNNHFLSLTDAILKSADISISSDYKIPTSLKKFCKDRISSSDSFKVPPVAVHEVGAYINKLKNKKSNRARQYQFYDVKTCSF